MTRLQHGLKCLCPNCEIIVLRKVKKEIDKMINQNFEILEKAKRTKK